MVMDLDEAIWRGGTNPCHLFAVLNVYASKEALE
jgi:hypothetical protein